MTPHAGRDGATVVARLSADEATARRIGDVLGETFDLAEAAVATFRRADGQWMVEIVFRQAPDEAAVRDLVATSLPGAAAALAFERLADRDWVAAGMAELGPVEAGRIVVHGGHDRDCIVTNRIGIEIEAAQAFGTGHHATTRACLLALDRLARSRRPANVLDVGTGSGVLAIAAARLFRARVCASDIDRHAVLAARGNAARNRVGPLIEVLNTGGVGARRLRGRAPYDLILANILLAPLKAFAAPLSRMLARNGRIVLSGLLASHAQAALAAYRAQGLALERRITLEGWVTLVMRRKQRRGANGH